MDPIVNNINERPEAQDTAKDLVIFLQSELDSAIKANAELKKRLAKYEGTVDQEEQERRANYNHSMRQLQEQINPKPPKYVRVHLINELLENRKKKVIAPDYFKVGGISTAEAIRAAQALSIAPFSLGGGPSETK